MKKTIKLTIAFIGVLSCFASCEKDEIDTYSGGDNLYFTWVVEPRVQNGSVSDSLDITFAFTDASVQDSIVMLPISVQGKLTDYDRTVSIEVDAKSTGVKGTHFTIPETVLFKANQERDTIPVTFLRTPEMKTDTLSIVLNLRPNKDFTNTMQNEILDELTGETRNFTSFKFNVTDLLAEPTGWFSFYLGDFTEKKFFLMGEILNIDLFTFTKGGSERIPLSELQYYGYFMQRYLNEKALNGEVIYEDNGEEMIMGRGVQ